MEYSITLVVGDWSHDGHNETDNLFIKSNLSAKEIEKAYKKATKIIGFDFCQEVAAEYEDSNLSKEYLDTLISHGLVLEDVLDVYQLEDYLDNKDNGVYLCTESYSNIYLFIIKLGNDQFSWKFDSKAPIINIGGYGLLGN